MKKNIYCLTFIVIIAITSCGEKEVKSYYENGKIKEVRIYFNRKDTSTYLKMDYYFIGPIQAKGMIVNNRKNGFWQEWYADGLLKWEGKYKSGKREEVFPRHCKILFEDSVLRKNKLSYLKVLIDGIHPEDILIACTNGIIKISDRKENYDYMVTPKKGGVVKFITFVKKEGRMIQVSVDSLNVEE